MLTKYGTDVLRKFFAFVVIALGCTVVLIHNDAVEWIILAALFVASAFVLNFFRNPKRHPPQGSGIVLAPADGKIVELKELFEDEYMHADGIQVSIFMSPLDVHVNRFPVSGTVGYFRRVEGGYGAAFEHKSSERNHRTHIGVQYGERRLLFKQIAGAIARRIVADIAVGQTAVAGETFGMIKFGSRVDVIMEKSAEIQVRVGDRVVAGETILARLKSE